MQIPERTYKDGLFTYDGKLIDTKTLADLIDPGIAEEDRDPRAWEGDHPKVVDRKINVLYRRMQDGHSADSWTSRAAMRIVLERSIKRDPSLEARNIGKAASDKPDKEP